MWTIYQNITYHGPDSYVAVQKIVTGSIQASGETVEAATHDDIRSR